MADTATRNDPSKTGKKGKRDKLKGARDSALDRARATVEGLESNPIGVLVGGLAVGLIAGALIPRGDSEKQALKRVGKRLAEGASAAFVAAKATGKDQLSSTTLSKDAAKDTARKILDSAVSAVKDSRSKSTSAA